ncbi:hypothetical protein Poly41_69170 [Novipirellula artificiosorum]|uniref:Uncharacterized protein n=1 Tax=Novipirellula artificiosorum TaxID=2528016 RepID=A0A5C6CX57_9BACT|nr:hypothetical protein Poly41_69170 [Novipirellula artificiosorum]
MKPNVASMDMSVRLNSVLLVDWQECLANPWLTTNDGQTNRCFVEIDCQLCSRRRVQREIAIAGKDHQPNLLASGNYLIVGF